MARKIAAFLSGRRTRWIVVIFWLVATVVLAPYAQKLNDQSNGVQKNDVSAWLPANAEATKALNEAMRFQPSDTMPAVVVYDRAGQTLSAADLAKAKADLTVFKQIPYVVPDQVTGPFPGKGNKALETIVNIRLGTAGWGAATKAVDKMTDTARAGANGLDVHVTGQGGFAADSGKVFNGSDNLMIITIGVVALVLLLAYRSPVLLLRPLFGAGVALVVSQGLVYLLADHAGLTVNAQSSFILTVLVFGAATDYALLLIARYREELRRHESQHEAMAEAWYRSSAAILASAATVAISMLVLLLADLSSTKGLGPVCAIGIVVSVAVMLTLLPARLVRGPWLWFAYKKTRGRWVFWPLLPKFGSAEPTEGGLWGRMGRRIATRPRLVWLGTALMLVVLGVGVFSLKANGIPNDGSFTKTTQAVSGEKIEAKYFPQGNADPVMILTDTTAVPDVTHVAEGVHGVVAVKTFPKVVGDRSLVLATLTASPDSGSAMDTVRALRSNLRAVPGAHAKVGGTSAITLDMEDAAARDSRVIIPIVLLVVFMILALLLRALVAPLLLVVTVILSFGAALGVSALVFNNLFHFKGADASFPLMAFTFLVALGIDYNIFLVTRIREESERHGTAKGALNGLAATGGVITSAGLVLAGTFAALASLPLTFAAEIGFAVAFGVLLDTMIVRSVLVTALTLDVGRYMWWPSKLFRRGDAIEPEEDEHAPALAH